MKPTYFEQCKKAEDRLKKEQIADAAADAWYLLEYVTGRNRTWYLMHRMEEMPQEESRRYEELVEMRAAHIPLQHLTGVQEFMGFSFAVNEQVLIPRQDTEILVEEARKEAKAGDRILDLCTGSGCIAISLSLLCPGVMLTGADLSGEALEVAGKNAEHLGAQVKWIRSDLFDALGRTPYDMIVSNPPYIASKEIEELEQEVRLHEPYMALDGKEDGLYFYRKILTHAADYLKPDGTILFEIGWDQAAEVEKLMKENGFEKITVVRDLAGKDRVVSGKKPQNNRKEENDV